MFPDKAILGGLDDRAGVLVDGTKRADSKGGAPGAAYNGRPPIPFGRGLYASHRNCV